MKKKLLYGGIATLFLASPIITNFIVTHTKFEESNDWIGFYGNVLSSIAGLIGIILTIRFTTREENENRRLQVVPYLDISYEPKYDEVIRTTIEMREPEYNRKVVGRLTLHNVGLGSVVDLRIHDITFSGKKQNFTINSSNVVRVDTEKVFNLAIGIFLPEKTITNQESCQHHAKSRELKMKLSYKDLLGNEYSQNLVFIVSVASEYNPDTSICQCHVNEYLNFVSKPELIK
ncbi:MULTISPECIES: hypothetical protein [Bacillus cereus group]|uniref:hypothetical protein n=1 Tax=Bacillus cereus group TaxID=86661 RepID=UPI000BEC2A67|nr:MULTISPECIES: hypothetical protein [Bacillus cereus group]MDA2069892.1 hypothetical protein [Bacillus cereus]MDR4169538.1 hypothetical protein [Bacillus nitratireducens]PEC36825.1 hypothetical protein CON60_26090 [Bacillus toyonensis]PEP68468.1 hypothetical protein CN574_01610 [Bacillus toyonensis]PGL43180.1 hypothetical protein CN930_01245 [Bacillus cereus]